MDIDPNMSDVGDKRKGQTVEQPTKYAGNDNYGKPKGNYLTRLSAMSDAELGQQCELMIWLSAYASNNPRSDYHWQCDACYDECKTRNKCDIYDRAHARASRT